MQNNDEILPAKICITLQGQRRNRKIPSTPLLLLIFERKPLLANVRAVYISKGLIFNFSMSGRNGSPYTKLWYTYTQDFLTGFVLSPQIHVQAAIGLADTRRPRTCEVVCSGPPRAVTSFLHFLLSR